MFGMFFFLTQFLQDVLGFSPLRAGIAFLPMTAMLFGVSRGAPRLMGRVGPKALMIAGMVPAIAGMAWLSRVSPATGYWTGVIGPMLLLGGGLGTVFVPLTTAALAGVRPADSGAASSMVNVMQQVGGALGLAVLVAVYGTARRDAARHPLAGAGATTPVLQAHTALAHGMAMAFLLAAVFDAVSLIVIIALIRTRAPMDAPPRAAEAEEEALAV
jgi:hypothetical protein